MDKVLYRERQKNSYIIIAFTVIAIFFGMLSFVQIGLNKPLGNHPAPDGLLIGIFIVGIMGALFFNYQSLKLVITETEIRFSMGILTGETVIELNAIKSISMRKYSALNEFGGWGARYNDTTSCFTVSGNEGIEIVTEKEKFLIGTLDAAQVQIVINKLKPASPGTNLPA